MGESKELEKLLQEQLRPLVKKIDAEAFYPQEFILQLGRLGFFDSCSKSKKEVLKNEVQVVEEVAKVCMTTAFNIWCNLAALTYLRTTDNFYLRNEVLPLLENGSTLGGTGLSNPMKFYAGLEKLHLKATRTDGGYIVTGNLPAVSNLKPEHWFGIIAEVEEHGRVMFCVRANVDGLKLKSKLDYLGINGSATYSCAFDNVFIPDEWVLSDNADHFVSSIRPAFVIYQIPLGFGVTAASIRSIQKVCNKQGGCNQYLSNQPEELIKELNALKQKVSNLVERSEIYSTWNEIVEIRLKTVYLTSKATHACMIHQGSAGYLQQSAPSRRLRESYFLVNLSPTVRHLEKMVHLNQVEA